MIDQIIDTYRKSLEESDIGVIGAGPSSLTLAIFTNQKISIYEQDEIAGGHAKSFKIGPWTFDRGPHIMFSKDKKILNWMIKTLGNNVHTSVRNNKVVIEDRFIHYPIENDLGSLSLDDRLACLMGYVQAHSRIHGAISNLDQWFRNNFGDGLTDLYFKPYNEKIWKVPLSNLSLSWSDRIPNPPLEDVIKGALGIRTEGYTHQLNYQYPLKGGFQALSDAWYARVADQVKLGFKILQIALDSGKILLKTENEVVSHDWIVYTGYLDKLLEICAFEIPPTIVDDVSKLRVNGISCITFGVKGVDSNKFTALYIPDPRYPFNRISFPHVFSPLNAPEGHFLIQAEVTHQPSGIIQPEKELFDLFEKFCVDLNIITHPNDIVFRNNTFFSHAYVVYDEGYEARIQRVTEYFASKNILLHGRFGSFQYINTDMCIFESAKLALVFNKQSDIYSLLS